MKVKISSYINNPKLSSCLPQGLFIEMLAKEIKGEKYIDISNSILYDIEVEFEKRKEIDMYLKTVSSLNNKGIEYEKAGDIKKAIVKYEKCMEIMYNHTPVKIAWHSPDRLRILYKKINSTKELKFLETFTEFCNSKLIEFPEIYTKRLNQLKNLKL